MVSLICSVSLQPSSFSNPNTCFLPVVMVLSPPNLQHPPKKYLKQRKINQSLLGFSGFCGVARRCKSFEGESDSVLELELLEFMKNSRNPGMFPSKKELVDAGRGDLVDAIVKIGGWMTMGWGDEVENDSNLGVEYGSNGSERSGIELSEERNCKGVSFLDDSSSFASSSGRSLEMAAEDDSGIEGILQRLERQRNLSFGLKSGNNGTAIDYVNGTFDGSNLTEGINKDVDSCHLQRNGPPSLSRDRPLFDGNGLNRSYSNGINSPKMDTWRTWSVQRAGFLDTEFEAGEIDFGENNKQLGADTDRPVSEVVAITTDAYRAQDEKKDLDSYYKEIVHGDLKARLQKLEVELSSALHVIKSNTTDLSGKVKENLPKDLRQLSDVSEFQENEIMNAQDKLRSLRAKLAVLEGKMALAIVDAQRILDEKQKRINDARKALQLLCTTCIVWPNSGSEVLLSGSFDGWATQRKMTRSSTGVFSLFLKLYPGKYEIKFIVDGIWKVDPLRPIVNNNGFENNLLIIS